jgi:hypothetical protein
MSEGEALTPSEVREVEFYGDSITGAIVLIAGESRVYVPLRPICEYLGLTWPSQTLRLRRDEILAQEIRGVFIMKTPGRGAQEMLCLPLDLLPGWLFGITTSKVKPEYQEKIRRYRRECFRVLWDAFRPSIVRAPWPEPTSGLSTAAMAYEIAMSVANLAREQMELERRMDAAAQWAKGVESRLSTLELSIGPQQPISETQAAELAQHVKAVAHALSERGTANAYQTVYGELYRRYQIGTYRNLPQRRYAEALAWLQGWYAEVSGASEAGER